MPDEEREFVRWLAQRTARREGAVALGIGDDMAMLRPGHQPVLVTCDMLLDGVHFDSSKHALGDIGKKAAACSLSDCAAMAVQPVGAILSLALPRDFGLEQAKAIAEGVADTCEAHECELIGGDTTSWPNPLAIDVTMLATPYPKVTPVRRGGAQPNDTVFVTGTLGGSLLGKHLSFTPRVREAKEIAEALGSKLHAMIDLSDGLALDLDRVLEASGVGAVVDETLLLRTASGAAAEAARRDGRTVLDHVLRDGEDFELLISADLDESAAAPLGLRKIGVMGTEPGLRLRAADGSEAPLRPEGYQHL